MFGFTWNEENCLGFPCGERGGLKPFGRRVAEELFSRGVFADVSELSEMAASFRVPVIASHSLSRAVWRHKRNLTDGQIRRIADTGGLVGVNFVREFLGKKSIFEHIAHIVDTGGEDVIALGTDFDGTENPLYAGAEEMPRFFEDMKRAGLSPRLTEKIAYGNILRKEEIKMREKRLPDERQSRFSLKGGRAGFTRVLLFSGIWRRRNRSALCRPE